MNEDSILWEAYEHEPKKNSSDWFWVVGIITIAIIIICIMLDNTLFGIVVGLSVYLLAYYSNKEPQVIEVELGNIGIRVDKKAYLFESLDSYHIENKDTDPKLILKSKKFFMPLIIIRMDGADPFLVDSEIKKHLKEDDHPEPFLHKLLNHLGF